MLDWELKSEDYEVMHAPDQYRDTDAETTTLVFYMSRTSVQPQKSLRVMFALNV